MAGLPRPPGGRSAVGCGRPHGTLVFGWAIQAAAPPTPRPGHTRRPRPSAHRRSLAQPRLAPLMAQRVACTARWPAWTPGRPPRFATATAAVACFTHAAARQVHGARLAARASQDGIQSQELPPQQQQLDTSVWAYKPMWCQPWSILGTGAAVVGGVYAVSGGSPGWSTAAAIPMLLWWWLFLVVMPAQFREYAEQHNEQLARAQQAQQLAAQPRRQQAGDKHEG